MLKQLEQSAKPNNKNFFATEHLKADLRRRSIRGGAVTLITQASKFAIQMTSTVVIARLLTPEDYGLVAMASVAIKFVQMFKNFGLSTAVVQKSQINHQQVSTLFWINTAISTVIGVAIALLSPAIANFYQEPRLVNILLLMSVVFIFSGLSFQHEALMRRQMRFSDLAWIDITGMLVGVVTGLVAALLGAGYWSLVILQAAMAAAYNIGCWLVCRWRPGLPVWNSGIGSFLAFGGNLTAFNFVEYFSRNVDNILIGRYWGSQQLGLYAKAYQLLLLPIQQINFPITNVALPTLSRLRTQPEAYRRYYYKAILAITTVSMPVVALTFAAADKIILLLLGQDWLGAALIFRWLMPAAFIGTFDVAENWIYQSLGRTDRQLRIGVVMSAIDVVIFLISVRWGALGVAAAYGFSRPILWVPRILYCYRRTPVKLSRLLSTLAYPATASLLAAACLMYAEQLSILPSQLSLILSLPLDCLLYALFYLVIWSLLPRGRKILWGMLQMLKEFRSK